MVDAKESIDLPAWRDGRLPVLLLGLLFLPTSLQATFFPRSFFDDFPLGRSWISNGSIYNEHLVRDVGALFLAMVIVSLFAWARPALCWPVSIAWLAQGILHLTFHGRHLAGYQTIDKVGLVGSLVVVPLLAVWGLLTAQRDPRG